jgi:hypothetical protein
MAGGREGIRASEPAYALMSVGEKSGCEAKRQKGEKMEGTCTDNEEIERKGSLALQEGCGTSH